MEVDSDYESKEEQRLPVPGLLHGSDWQADLGARR
jgi:hypothetical protein